MTSFLVLLSSIAGAQVSGTPAQSAISIASVTDVAVDRNGRIYIADSRDGKVHILDRQLSPIATIGQRGTKDGEFLTLRSVRVVDDSSFAAIDRYLRTIAIWTWRGDKPGLRKTLKVPFEPADVCVLSRSRMLVVGLFENHRVHEVDGSGAVIRSFGPVDPALLRPIAARLASGSIACVQDQEFVLTSTAVPRVELFRLGDSIAHSHLFLAPFRPMEMEAIGNRARFSNSITGFHAAGRPIVAGDTLLIAARIIGRQDGVRGDSVRWFSIDKRRARVIGVLDSEGRLFPLGDGRALRVIEDAGVSLSIAPMPVVRQAPAPN